MGALAPLILTLELDPATFAVVDELRTAHFPPERNFIPAHITLFHALPGAEIDAIGAELAALAATTAPFAVAFPALRFLGHGVALEVASPELVALRRQLAYSWAGWLGPQDRHGYRPHLTIQNKVAPAVARQLFDQLSAGWQGLDGRGSGLLLWHYRGGPWERAARLGFG